MEPRRRNDRTLTMEEDYEFIENSEESESEDKFESIIHRNFMQMESSEKIKINLSLEKINQHAKNTNTQRKHSLQAPNLQPPFITINPFTKSRSSEKLTLPEIILTPFEEQSFMMGQSSPSPEIFVDNQLSGADMSNHSSGHSSASGFYSDDNGGGVPDKPYTLNLMNRNLNPIKGNSSKKGR